MTLLQITAKHFCAGIELSDVPASTVVSAAPIVYYMVGWPYNKVIGYCKYKGWGIETLDEEDEELEDELLTY